MPVPGNASTHPRCETGTNFEPIMKRVPLLFLFLVLPLSSGIAQPGVSDLLTPLLKNIDGFNVWFSHPSYTQKTSFEIPKWAFDRYAFSLKYNVYSFGDSTIFRDFTETPVEEDHDVTGDAERVPARLSKGNDTLKDTVVDATEKKWSYSYFDVVRKQKNISLNFGFSYSSPVTVELPSGFSATLQYSGFFVSAVYTYFFGHFNPTDNFLYEYHSRRPSDDSQYSHGVSLSYGLQADFYSLSGISATFQDPAPNSPLVPLSFSSGLTFSQEVFLGFGFHLTGDVSAFVDADYQINQLGSLSFTPAISGDTNFSKIFTKLPKTFNLNNFQLKLGVSVTIPSLGGATAGSSGNGSSSSNSGSQSSQSGSGSGGRKGTGGGKGPGGGK